MLCLADCTNKHKRWHFRREGFSLGTAVSSPPSSVNGSANKIES